jgi:hypothetical protein
MSAPNAPGPLGWIAPEDRTQAQQDAHNAAVAKMPRYALPYKDPGKVKVMLTDFWKVAEVVADIGYPFTGFGQHTGSCFIKGSPVQMFDGTEKAIEVVSVNDEVISHTGARRKVVRIFQRLYTGTIYTFHVKGHRFPFTVTADHDVLTVPYVRKTCREPAGTSWRMRPGEPTKIKAADAVVGDKMLLAYGRQEGEAVTFDLAEMLPDSVLVDKKDIYVAHTRFFRKGRSVKCNRFIELDERLAWFLGLYAAEGSLCRNVKKETVNGFLLSLSSREQLMAEQAAEYIREIFSRDIATKIGPPSPGSANKESCLQLKVFCTVVGRFIHKLMPGNVWDKRIPAAVFQCSRSVKMAFLRGWMDGDGHMQSAANCPGRHGLSLRGVSASSNLVRDMARLCLSCGLKPSALRRKKASHQRVASMDLYLSGPDALEVYPERESIIASAGVKIRNTSHVGSKAKHGFAVAVEKIETEEVANLPVYCCEVEVDHTIIVNSIAVGQCVGVSAGGAVCTLSCIQRMLADNPTKAFIPFWPYNYGRTRYEEGDRGQGEGAIDSVMAHNLTEGVIDLSQPGLPTFTNNDGLWLTSQLELQWSDGSRIDQKYIEAAKKFPLGSATPLSSVQDIQMAIVNGYPVLDGCNNYVGNGSIKGSGDNAYVTGRYDGRGGHSTTFYGYWMHPNDGPLYLYGNTWPGSTYPKDPAGGGRCTVWLPESEVQKLFSTGGSNGETVALSHLTYMPAQPALLDYYWA